MSTERAGTDAVDQEMRSIIFYLTAIGHIDGEFVAREQEYILRFIAAQVASRVRAATSDEELTRREVLTQRWSEYYRAVFTETDHTVRAYFTESVGNGEDPREFVHARLKLRCYELFRRFSPENQARLLRLADGVIQADGTVHPNEAAFRNELAALLAAPPSLPPPPPEAASDASTTQALDYVNTDTLVVEPARTVAARTDNHRFFQSFERPYAQDRAGFATQIQADLSLIDKTLARLGSLRAAGEGALRGVQRAGDLTGRAPFLDQFVYALPPQADKEYELLVLGDLHGCYSCMKAALMQADFFAKMDAHLADPEHAPAMKLVLLGDYIDRGNYSFNGVLRTAMLLFLAAPEHVYVLRGNHEYFVEYGGHVLSGVRPAEAIASLINIADPQVFVAYKRLFDQLPSALLFGSTLFVHAGIPRDDTLFEKWTDLSTLNDPEVRFQMMWSDPSEAEFIPLELQKSNARFPFGVQQFKHFMARLGCTTMVRGHEVEPEGWRQVYDEPEAKLFTLFSAGGAANADLPEESNYREVAPVALTVKYKNGLTQFQPFAIDYARYNQAERNAFYR